MGSFEGERDVPAPCGFSTRAIRAASRAPRVDQTPMSVPIYQTATFAAADALAVRMDRHAATALAPAARPERQDGVNRRRYPGLATHPQRAVAARQLRSGEDFDRALGMIRSGRFAAPAPASVG